MAQQAKGPAAFLSYAHLDDEASSGQITRLRNQLTLAVSAAFGTRFEIFQDRDGIAWGQHWANRLDEALEQALFLIPILTPAYFKSEPCRTELEKFLELERRTGRKDLILPIYFRTTPVFEQRSDPLATILNQRQYRDWREFRHKPIPSPEVTQKLEELADEIVEAIHRPPPVVDSTRDSSFHSNIIETKNTSATINKTDLKPNKYIESLWAIQFIVSSGQAISGQTSAGIVVFKDGRIVGGDSFYYYLGHFTFRDDDQVSGEIAVVHYAGKPSSVFGHLPNFRLQVEGFVQKDRFVANGHIVGHPSEKIQLHLTRLAAPF